MHRSIMAVALGLAWPAWTAAQPVQESRASVLSVQVNKGLPPEIARSQKGSTVVKLLLELPGQNLVGCDSKASNIAQATDNNGLDLLIDPERPNKSRSIAASFDSFGAGTFAALEFRLPNWPGPDATKIRIKGHAVVLCGKHEMVVEKKKVPLEKDVTAKVGPATFEVTASGEKSTLVQVSSTKPIKSIEFLKDDVTVIESKGTLRATLDFGAKGPGGGFGGGAFGGAGGKKGGAAMPPKSYGSQATLYLQGFVERCTVRLTYFESIEPLTVPFDVEFGLGL